MSKNHCSGVRFTVSFFDHVNISCEQNLVLGMSTLFLAVFRSLPGSPIIIILNCDAVTAPYFLDVTDCDRTMDLHICA